MSYQLSAADRRLLNRIIQLQDRDELPGDAVQPAKLAHQLGGVFSGEVIGVSADCWRTTAGPSPERKQWTRQARKADFTETDNEIWSEFLRRAASLGAAGMLEFCEFTGENGWHPRIEAVIDRIRDGNRPCFTLKRYPVDWGIIVRATEAARLAAGEAEQQAAGTDLKSGWYSLSQLAEKYGLDGLSRERLRKRLEAWRLGKGKHLEKTGWMKLETRGPREEMYLFHIDYVQPILDKVLDKQKVSSEAPAKKISHP
jgi:hypothetical protein